MTYCFHCGEWIPDGNTNCPHCGAPKRFAEMYPGQPYGMPTGQPYGVSMGQPYYGYPYPTPPQPAVQAELPAPAEPAVQEEQKKERPLNGPVEHGPAAMLKLSDITKDYKIAAGKVHALKGISLEFRKSEFVCILGQSGCGKTTMLNIIGGLDHYTSGDLVIQGKSTKNFKDRDWDVYRNHRIGFIFQTYNLIPHQTVLGNVELALTIAGIGKEERRRRARQALERVGLGQECNKLPNQLSGGQMQRVAIARALVNDPDILLADEPTGALDSKTSVQIMELIKEIANEKLVIMVTHNAELAEEYASRIVRLKDGLVEGDSNPYEGAPALPEAKSGKKARAKMGFFTSLSLSFKNLLTKRGRTIITSVAGSIGIISVCLVLALSSGFQKYIRHTEEDMLSYYPLHISESTFDINAVMSAMTNPVDMPDLSKIEDKVYVNSFLTGLAQGIAVQNNITQEYVDYLNKGKEEHPDWFSAIQYDYGLNLDDFLFTNMTVGGVASNPEEKVMNFSTSALRNYLIQELINEAPEYQSLLRFVNLFTDVVNKMPGTADYAAEDYGKYVQTQYDCIYGNFPTNEHEAVLVVGPNNDVIDLTLVQLGFMTEEQFLNLFYIGQEKDEEEVKPTAIQLTADESADDPTLMPFSRIMEQQYGLYYTKDETFPELPENMNDANGLFQLYTSGVFKQEGNTVQQKRYPFSYSDHRDDLSPTRGEGAEKEEIGIDFKISGILRLKPNFTYGCLSEGLNLTEGLINKYIETNMENSEILKFIHSTAQTTTVGEGDDAVTATTWWLAPSQNLASDYTLVEQEISFMGLKVKVNIPMAYSNATIRALGGEHLTNSIYLYPANFDAKDSVLGYLDTWNDTHNEGEVIKYNDNVGLLMGMVQTILDVITYVLVAFTAISLVVSSVMIGIITYVSVVERIKEIGVLRSLGARKQDIRNLFNAETFIIGLTAGLIGIGVTYILAAIVSAIIESLSGIAGIASLPITTAAIMVLVSVVLTLISGLIPAQAAAKKDPVIALRTE